MRSKLISLAVLLCVSLVGANHLAAQGLRVQGKVTDVTGESAIGVSVVEEGTSNYAITDIDGQYSLRVSGSNAVITVSGVGFKTQNVSVNGRSTVNIVLEMETESLEDAVVVGYGTQKKKLVTGSTVQIKGDDISKLSTVDPVSAMQSSTPGVAITQASGQPGADYKIYIRGIGTVGNSAPLVIIDGFIGGDLSTLNPNDIASIDVLKDAASSAIYGARAANGVIIVTTKTGSEGSAQVSYDGYIGISNPRKVVHAADALTYASLIDEYRLNMGGTTTDFATYVPNWADIQSGRFKGTDWVEEFINHDAISQNHNLSITGGTKDNKYSTGFSYTNQDGVWGQPKAPNFQRYTARINSDHVLKRLGDREFITFGEKLTINERIFKGSRGTNNIQSMYCAPPFTPLHDENAIPEAYGYGWPTTWTTFFGSTNNPIAAYDLGNGESKNNYLSLRANAYLTIQPIEKLVFRTSYTFDYWGNSSRSAQRAWEMGTIGHGREHDNVSQSQSHGAGHMLENTLNYKFSVKDNNFDVLVGQSIQIQGLGDSINASNIDPIASGLDFAYISNTSKVDLAQLSLGGSPNTRHQIASFFGRVNYDYNETYLATVVLRADGSSNFAKGHRWGYFPSVSLGWVMTNEAFMESTRDWLSFLKLRASWGQNGNESIANFQYLSTVAFDAGYGFGDDKNANIRGSRFDILPNEDITWETSEQLDLGIDARFFAGRLSLVADYYKKTTKDWLVAAPALMSNGTGTPDINGGDVENKGFELGLSWNDHRGDFYYGISGNVSYNHNEVTRIDNAQGIIYGARNDLGSNFEDVFRAQVGYPIGYFIGYKNGGIYQNQSDIDAWAAAGNPVIGGAVPGDFKWIDTNGDGQINDADRVKIGQPHPTWHFGLNLNFAYKGFDLVISGYGVAGGDILQNHRHWGDWSDENFSEVLAKKRWHGEGTSTTYPRLTASGHTNWKYVSTQYLESGDFFRIDNVTLGYDFQHLAKSKFFSKLRLYATVQNLAVITNYSGMDPEISHAGYSWGQGFDVGQVPRPQTYILGVNVKF